MVMMTMMMSTTTTTCSMMSIVVTATTTTGTVMVFTTRAMSVMIMMMMSMAIMMMAIDAVTVRFALVCALILFAMMFAVTALVLVEFLQLGFLIRIQNRTVNFVTIYIIVVLLCFSTFDELVVFV